MEKPFRLLIVDDQPRARQSLSALLVIDFPQIKIFEASNGKEALGQVEAIHPDIVVMDVLMPELDGVSATRLIKAMYPRIKIILYSMYAEYQTTALTVGADAFITKGEPPEFLVTTITALVKSNSVPKSAHKEE
jgi:DNA-binding NarL/FixJ family response regulator